MEAAQGLSRHTRKIWHLAAASALLVTAFVTAVFAQSAPVGTCPDYYRFVDFGLVAQDGSIHRGGPTFRVENLAGQQLILPQHTTCLSLRETAVDGHGNPIPVVSSVSYDQNNVDQRVRSLRLSPVDDPETFLANIAEQHHLRLAAESAVVLLGSDYLCVSALTPSAFSCQFVSPFGAQQAPIVYCTQNQCTLPAMAIKDRIFATARWDQPVQSLAHAEAVTIKNMLSALHDFLTPLTS